MVEIKPINWKMVSHPVNWLIIFMMLVIAGIAGHLILSYFGIEPQSKANTAPTNGQSSSTPPAVDISSYAGRVNQ
jgi:hypothetical protein